MSGPFVRRAAWSVAVLLGFVQPLLAQTQTPDNWDVTKPRGTPKRIEFTTAEGTWMSTDIHARWPVDGLQSAGPHLSRACERRRCRMPHAEQRHRGELPSAHFARRPDHRIRLRSTGPEQPMAAWIWMAATLARSLATPDARYMEPTWSADGRFLVAQEELTR